MFRCVMSDISCEREAGSSAIRGYRQVKHNRVMKMRSDEQYFLARNKFNGQIWCYGCCVGSISAILEVQVLYVVNDNIWH